MADTPPKFEDTVDAPKFEDTVDVPKFEDTAPIDERTSGRKLRDDEFVGGISVNMPDKHSVPDAIASIKDGVPLAGLAQKGGERFGAGLAAATTERTFEQALKEIQAANEKETTERHARSPQASQFGAGLGSTSAPQMGKSATGRVAKNSALVAADAATKAEDPREAVKEALKAGSLSTALSLFMEGMTGGKAVKGFANRRAVKALDPTLAQTENLMARDSVDALGDELLKKKVVQAGDNVENMAPRLEELLSNKGKRLGEIRDMADQAGAKIDMNRTKHMGDIMNEAAQSSNTGSAELVREYLENAQRLAKRPNRSIKDAQGEIGLMREQVNYQKPFADRSAKEQALSELSGDLVGQVDDQIKTRVPELAAEHGAIKDQFGLFKDGNKILDKSVARSARNNDFGLRDLILAGGTTKREGVGGLGKMAVVAGASKLARERGNSALAVGADKVASLLQSNSLGKYTNILESAKKRGNAAFMATHALLLKNDPEYAAMVSGETEPVK